MTETLARNIRRHLDEREMSMAELSRRAGAGSTAVFDIMHHRARSPRLETIEKIATALDTTVIALLSEDRRAEVNAALLDAFSRLPEQDRDRLLSIVAAWLPDTGKGGRSGN